MPVDVSCVAVTFQLASDRHLESDGHSELESERTFCFWELSPHFRHFTILE